MISTDLGGSATGVAGCEGAGDDGLFRAVPVRATASCNGSSVRAFSSVTRVGDAVAFSHEVGCAVRIGSRGCAIEQPLEAALRALSVDAPRSWTQPDYGPPVFRDGTFGHGAGANRGFLSDTSWLAVVIITNEDDCSVADVDGELDGSEDAACAGGSRLPISRYVDGLLGLRRHAADLSIGVIAGVPSRLTRRSYDEVLADASMQSDDPARASCTSEDGRMATAPRRLVETFSQLEARGVSTVLTSICDSSFGLPYEFIERRTGQSCCVPAREEARVDCEALFTLAASSSELSLTRCEQIPGADLVDMEVAIDEDGERTMREVWRVPSISPDEMSTAYGWFVADDSPFCTDGFGLTIEGNDVRITCREVSDEPTCAEP